MNKITVVIPNYNGQEYLQDCLQALYDQAADAPSFEVVVVDDGSTDRSAEKAEEIFPAVRVIRLSENMGFCYAVNIGINQSESPYIILLNNDTKVRPGFVKNLYNAITADDDIFSVSAKMLMWDNPDLIDDAGDGYNALGWAFARGKGKEAALYSQREEVFSACAGAAIYRRSILEQIGQFDEQHFAYLEDLDVGYRARIYGYRNFYEPTAEVLHYGSASTGSRYNPLKTELSSANNVYVIFKNMPLFQLIWNLPLLIPGFVVKFVFFCGKKMGKLYAKGLMEGIRRSLSAAGRRMHVSFRWSNRQNYLDIQLELYKNLFRMKR